MKTTKIIAITTGDQNGIGFEVTAKALFELGPSPLNHYFIFRHIDQKKIQNLYFKKIEKKFIHLEFSIFKLAYKHYLSLKKSKQLKQQHLFDIASTETPPDWFVEATLACKKKLIHGLVTGPLSKTLILKSGYSFIGHTGFFKKLYPKTPLFMGFIGRHFNVVLATDHIPLNQVENTLNRKLIQNAIIATQKLQKLTSKKKPICLLGLNPHAGEQGLLGSFEKKILNSTFMSKFSSIVVGPHTPDAVFFKPQWNRYSAYLALYHDQGLIPFKMIHGQNSGIQITLGLPFIRTSVDHGTAFDIFNTNKANHRSMRHAIELCSQLI